MAVDAWLVNRHRAVRRWILRGSTAALLAPAMLPGDVSAQTPDPARSAYVDISGIVVDSAGAPVSGARVSLIGSGAHVLTDSTGRFVLHREAAGARTLVVRRLGFAPVERQIVVRPGDGDELRITMGSASSAVLPEVVVRARWQETLAQLGFYNRRERRIGGLYLDVEQMDKMVNRPKLASILATADNLNYVNGRLVGRFRSTVEVTEGGASKKNVQLGGRYTCVAYVLDGVPWLQQNPTGTRVFTAGHGREPLNDPSDLLPPADVAAIEVYRPEQVPRELPFYTYTRGCEAVVIWTRAYLNSLERR